LKLYTHKRIRFLFFSVAQSVHSTRQSSKAMLIITQILTVIYTPICVDFSSLRYIVSIGTCEPFLGSSQRRCKTTSFQLQTSETIGIHSYCIWVRATQGSVEIDLMLGQVHVRCNIYDGNASCIGNCVC